jgi:hypothetical protein
VTDEEFLTELRRRLGPDSPARRVLERMLTDAGIGQDEPAEEERRAA